MQALRREFMIGSTKTASWLCFCSWTVEGECPRKCKKQLWTSHLLEHFLVFNFLVMVGKKIKSCSYCLAAQVARGLLEPTCQVSTFFFVHRDTHLLWVFADVGLIGQSRILETKSFKKAVSSFFEFLVYTGSTSKGKWHRSQESNPFTRFLKFACHCKEKIDCILLAFLKQL